MGIKKKYSGLKRAIIVLLVLMIAFWSYVEIINRNSENMTVRQKVLKAVYPAWMWWAKIKEKNTATLSNEEKGPPISFYSLTDTLINGTPFDLTQLKGKKILLVNTASDCGYTGQYEDLEKLYKTHQDKLVIIGFPANDFKEQEKGDDATIEKFCKQNFGVTFPLMKKSTVIKKADQNKIFEWLTDETKNGWNNQQPTWNFCKYIVDENGKLTHFFGSTIKPLSKEVLEAIE